MATFARLDDPQCCMMGLPGINPAPEILATLRGAERVTLVVDPGAKRQGVNIAQAIGAHKTYLLETIVKIDDGILAEQPSKQDVARLLQSAMHVGSFVTGKRAA
jgi:hypothetical protein